MTTSVIRYLSNLREMDVELANILDVYSEIESAYYEGLGQREASDPYSVTHNIFDTYSMSSSSNFIFSARSEFLPASGVTWYTL